MESMGGEFMKNSPSRRHLASKKSIRSSNSASDTGDRGLDYLPVDAIMSPHAKNGELPLFFPATSIPPRQPGRSPHPHIKTGHERREEPSPGHSLRHQDAGWPLASHEMSSWADSFRFEVDPQDGERLQAMLDREDCDISTGRILEKQSLAEKAAGTPGSSFSFRDGIQEINGSRQYGFLKPCRQLEKQHGSARIVAGLIAEKQASEPRQRHSDRFTENDSCPLVSNTALEVLAPASGRDEVLQKLRNLKANGSRMVAEAGAVEASPKREDMIHQKLKSSLPLVNDSLKSSWKQSPRNSLSREQLPQHGCLGELEIMPTTQERRSPSSSKLRECPSRPANTLQETVSPPSKLKGERRAGHSIQEQMVSFRKHSLAMASNVSSRVSSPSPDHGPSVSAAIPFQWEEEPGKPKSIAAAAQRALARKLSREGIVLEGKVGSQQQPPPPPAVRHNAIEDVDTNRFAQLLASEGARGRNSSAADNRSGEQEMARSSSHRYYGRGHFRGHSRETSWGKSSRRYSNAHEKEAQIDLIAPAAAKFLVEPLESPVSTPTRHSSSSASMVAVPFKWEDAPGKAKVDDTAASKPHTLQLPPRLAVPSHRGSETFSRELRGGSYFSHPLSGFFSPCMTASSPARKQHDDAAQMQYGASKSLPPKAPSSRYGFVGHCSSTPREGCQIRVSKSFDKTASNPPSKVLDKAFSGPLPTTTDSPNLKPRRLFSSELKPSHPWMQKAAQLSPTSILCGPDEGSSQTSASNIMFSSGDLDAYTQQTTSSGKSASNSSSSVSYESIEADFDEPARPCMYALPTPPFDPPQQSSSEPPHGTPSATSFNPTPTAANYAGKEHYAHRSNGSSDGVKSLLKLCKHGTCLGKPKSQQRLGTIYSPTLANYFQCLEFNNEGATSSGLLDKQGAPTSSGYLNCKGEPLALKDLPTESSNPPKASPERATRLPYTMPSVEEQEQASRELCKAPNVDFAERLGGKNAGGRFNPSRSGASTPARIERYLISTAQASHGEDVCPSPAYAAALELLSPAVNLMAQRRKGPGTPKVPTTKWPGPKVRRRVRFILSICKTLKRVLFRQQRHRKPSVEPKLMYHDEPAPTTFQFSKPN